MARTTKTTGTTPATPATPATTATMPAMPATSYRADTGTRRAAYVATAPVTHGDGTQATTRDVLDWTAWLAAGHADGLKAGNLTPPIAQRAMTWLAAHDVPALAVGDRVSVAYVARILDTLATAGVPADDAHVAAMRAHYGA